METAVKAKNSLVETAETFNPADWLPPEIGEITDHQTDLPRIAKDPKAIAAIEARISQVPTTHDLYNHDSRQIDFLPPNSVHLWLPRRPTGRSRITANIRIRWGISRTMKNSCPN